MNQKRSLVVAAIVILLLVIIGVIAWLKPGQQPTGSQDQQSSSSEFASGGIAEISVSVSVADLVSQSPVQYRLTYAYTIRNISSANVTDLVGITDLRSTFPAPASFSVVELTGDRTTNPSFNGTTNQNIFGANVDLAAGEQIVMYLTVLFSPNGYTGGYTNEVTVSGNVSGSSGNSSSATSTSTSAPTSSNTATSNPPSSSTSTGSGTSTVTSSATSTVSSSQSSAPGSSSTSSSTVPFVENTGSVTFELEGIGNSGETSSSSSSAGYIVTGQTGEVLARGGFDLTHAIWVGLGLIFAVLLINVGFTKLTPQN